MNRKGRCWELAEIYFESDGGKRFAFGKAGSNTYGMSLGNGMDMALGTSQGFSKIGETVQTQSVAGRIIDVKGEFYGTKIAERKDALRNVCAPLTAGKLFFWGKWFIRVFVKSAPTFSPKRGDGRFMMQFYAPFPFYSQMQEKSYSIGEVTKQFRLPINFSKPHRFGTTSTAKATDVNNDGDVPVKFRVDIHARGICTNVTITDLNSRKMMRINGEIGAGDQVAVYQDDNGALRAELHRNGEPIDILGRIDDDSNLFQLQPGENLLAATEDGGNGAMTVRFSFHPARAVLYEA